MPKHRFLQLVEPSLESLLQQSINKLEEEKRMKHQVEVSSREEGKAVEKALANPVTKAIVVVEGVLAELTDAQAERVLAFVKESRDGNG